MLRFQEMSLTLQLPLIAAASALLVGLCILFLAVTSGAYLQDERDTLYGEALAQQIATSVSDPLQRGDLLSARASLQRFIDSSLAIAVDVRDVEGMPIGAAGVRDGTGARQYEAEIRIGEDTAGHVRVVLNESLGRESRWRFLFSMLALIAALSLLVFIAFRAFAQRLSSRVLAVQSQLQLGDAAQPDDGNELLRLQHSVERLPLDMLRGHAAVPAAVTDVRQGSILFVHLASLVRYVETLSESNLHRYSRRLQQIIQAAAQCYRGALSVTRPFGLLITFSPQPNAGSEALRAASCARLIALIANGLAARTQLSLDLAMALGPCEEGAQEIEDFYPQLHLHGMIDELRENCLEQTDFPAIRIAQDLLEDQQLSSALAAQIAQADSENEQAFIALLCLSEEQETLLAHQAEIIIERIKPLARSESAQAV